MKGLFFSLTFYPHISNEEQSNCVLQFTLELLNDVVKTPLLSLSEVILHPKSLYFFYFARLTSLRIPENSR